MTITCYLKEKLLLVTSVGTKLVSFRGLERAGDSALPAVAVSSRVIMSSWDGVGVSCWIFFTGALALQQYHTAAVQYHGISRHQRPYRSSYIVDGDHSWQNRRIADGRPETARYHGNDVTAISAHYGATESFSINPEHSYTRRGRRRG